MKDTPGRRDKKTVKEVRKYIEYILMERGLGRNTIIAYAHDINKFSDFLKGRHKEILKAGPDDITGFLLHLRTNGLSVRTYTRSLIALRGMYKFS